MAALEAESIAPISRAASALPAAANAFAAVDCTTAAAEHRQEKAVLAPIDGMVKRVLKTADFKENKQMVSVREGELIVELGPVPRICGNEACGQPIPMDNIAFCPYCGVRVS